MSKREAASRGWWNWLATGVVILVMAGIIIAVQIAGNSSPPTGGQRITLEPEIIANLTRLPQATPLSGDSASKVNELRALVDSCPDYASARRSQMDQHIEWLLNPALIPSDIVIALGDNPSGKLLYGMATYTSIQWRVDNRPPDSCLVPVGKMLNEMLIAVGEEPFAIFDDTQ